MLANLFLLAAVMQAGLATAHIEDGKGQLATLIKSDHTINSTKVQRNHDHHLHHDHTYDHGSESTHLQGQDLDYHIEARGVGGKVILANRCHYDIWVWSVSEGVRFPSTLSSSLYSLSPNPLCLLSL
jgi:hypothetical protein